MERRPPTITRVLVATGALLTLAAAPPSAPSDVGSEGPTVETPSEAPGTNEAGATTTRTRAASGERLEGAFGIDPGQCEGGPVTGGSYFRMVQPGGSPDSGPYVENGDSPCGDDSYTPLRPGSDGGLVTGGYQPHPDPAFDGSGNALADRITRPQSFFGTRFSTATNPTDPQTGTEVRAPEVIHDGAGGLGGDLRAFAAAWNGQHFNQGAPKPDGSRPGNTLGPTGTYDPGTGRYTLEWSSQIQGGPFDNFTGVWHLEGTFTGQQGTSTASQDGTADRSAAQTADPGGGTETAGQTDGSDPDQQGRLADTGPGLPIGLALMLIAAAAALTPRRRARR